MSSPHRLAVVVPYRDDGGATAHGEGRRAHLERFIPHMMRFLGRAGVKFRIVVVEQAQGGLFNKGLLFNAGVSLSPAECDYFALHDVDQLPEHPDNTYAYPGPLPVHLCSASSQFGYRLAYDTMVGGALLMRGGQYARVNGFSNRYWGWGLEDDDMYVRIRRVFGAVVRLPAEIGRYHALEHPRAAGIDATRPYREGRAYLERVISGAVDFRADGLSTARFDLVERHCETTHERFVLDIPGAPRLAGE